MGENKGGDPAAFKLAEQIDVLGMNDAQLGDFMRKNGISLKLSEARKVAKEILGRNPTLVEFHIFNTEWSEHTSYKSSRTHLKQLPTEGPKVILGPSEDSGIIELGFWKGERYGIVVSHESHNHPSQVVPYEGAATGIGGIVRDVLCMGAEVIATADPLRFGQLKGKNANRTKYIATSVVDGIAGYSNPLGVPNLGGDAYFHQSFDDNCLVNVVSLGVVKEKDILHSSAPKNSEGYDVILVGKATDISGFGGATFASLILDEEDEDMNKGAVQVPDPFLKNVLFRSTYKVFEELRAKKIPAGFKDLGAGGVMCVTSELGADAGKGVQIDLDKVHISMDIPPYVIACSETQERFAWIVPPEFTPRVLEIYNDEFELPKVAEGARAVVIGKVRDDDKYVMTYKGKKVCEAPIKAVTTGILYDREVKDPKKTYSEPSLAEPTDYAIEIMNVMKHPEVASKEIFFKHYDTEVQGRAVIRPGEADAGVMIPVIGAPFGVALATDSNPRYGLISPYWGAVAGVAESMRNVAAVGAVPTMLTDCLCYGNPEKPEQFWQFAQGVKGVADAAKNIHYKDTKHPTPIISGNVSFYNENAKGSSVAPSAIIGCVGIMEDYSKAITTAFKESGSAIILIGERKDELGGSTYYDIHGELGANVPMIDFQNEERMINAVVDLISKRKVKSCHDISDGGLCAAICEMSILGKTGCEVMLDTELKPVVSLFSQTSGFVLEIEPSDQDEILKYLKKKGIWARNIGSVQDDNYIHFNQGDTEIAKVDLDDIEKAWRRSLEEQLK